MTSNQRRLLVHGVAIFPGKPTVLGVCPGPEGGVKPLIGIPGYPVSAVLALQEFVHPLMAYMMGAPTPEAETIEGLALPCSVWQARCNLSLTWKGGLKPLHASR